MRRGRIILACIALAGIAACSDETTRPIEEKAFTGILETNVQCEILGGDTTDFQPRPETSGLVPTNYSLIMACPNPTDKITSIRFQIPQTDSVWLFVFDRPGGEPVDTLFNRGSTPAGSWTVQWNHDGPDGIYRVVMGTGVGFESYGDVQFDENWTPSDTTPDLAVCAPEEPEPNPRTCIPEDKSPFYYDVWRSEFMARNGIDEDYLNRHLSSIWTSSNCWNSGITFRVNYRITIGWAVVNRSDKFIIMLYESENAYRHLNIPRDVFLDHNEVRRVLDHRVFGSSVGPVKPLESLPYETCEKAVQAFQDSTGSGDILPTGIAYYVPGKIPREDGYPYFIGRGVVDEDANECIVGYFNLFSGESDAWMTLCEVE